MGYYIICCVADLVREGGRRKESQESDLVRVLLSIVPVLAERIFCQ